jgi:UDP-glucose 4-epimerase
MSGVRTGDGAVASAGSEPYVVIGANGFLGSHLVDALVRSGRRVRAFDRFSARPRFATSNAVDLIQGDFLNRADVVEAVDGASTVFHFLSSSTPATAVGDVGYDLRTNVLPTLELLDICASAGVERFFFASSGGTVYGRTLSDQPSCEGSPTRPISPYGVGKVVIETHLDYFRRERALETVALRIANPYGPRQDGKRAQGLIPIALRHVRDGEPVRLFGDGTMVRDYLHVEDLMTMLMRVVDGPARYGVYNLGSGEGISVAQVLDVIRHVTATDFVVERCDQPRTFVPSAVLDVARFEAEFGPRVHRSLYEGIEQVWSLMTG